jgi:hypothetical protein
VDRVATGGVTNGSGHAVPASATAPRTHGGYAPLQLSTGWQDGHVQQNVVYTPTTPAQPPSLLMNGQPFMGTPDLSSDISEDSSLASMAALRNPAWWNEMMLPG